MIVQFFRQRAIVLQQCLETFITRWR